MLSLEANPTYNSSCSCSCSCSCLSHTHTGALARYTMFQHFLVTEIEAAPELVYVMTPLTFVSRRTMHHPLLSKKQCQRTNTSTRRRLTCTGHNFAKTWREKNWRATSNSLSPRQPARSTRGERRVQPEPGRAGQACARRMRFRPAPACAAWPRERRRGLDQGMPSANPPPHRMLDA